MDPATLAASATAFLAPYLLKAGQKLAGQAVDHLPEGVNKVWNYVMEKFHEKPAAVEAANDLAADADDEDNQAAFRKELKKLLQDPAVIAEFSGLLARGKESQGISVSAGDGGVAIHGDVQGNIVLGNNAITMQDNNGTVNINSSPDTKKKKN
ncbi:MAG: hypothetical protein ABI986_00725 [Chloroflexota bacterium]